MSFSYKTFAAFPPACDREAWNRIAEQEHLKPQLRLCIEHAEKALTEQGAFSPFTGYSEYIKSGDRSRFEEEYFLRRENLEALLVAECVEYKGRFLPAIADLSLTTATEYTWVLPAHVRNAFRDDPSKDDLDPLPVNPPEYVDLFAAATGAQLALVLTLLGQELRNLSGNLADFVRNTVLARTVVPVEQHPEKQHWMGICTNWNSWICSNLLWTADMMLAGEETRFSAFVRSLENSMTSYYEQFPADGCCSEGPGYWWPSVGRYLVFCEGIYRASGGANNPFRSEKFKAMAEYIAHARYTGEHDAHFCDCSARLPFYYGLTGLMAERFSSPLLASVCRRMCAYAKIQNTAASGGLTTFFHLFAPMPPPADREPEVYEKLYPVSREYYLHRGDFFFAVKGGNNGVPHNHLDVGQFVIGYCGEMLVLDFGASQYRRETFNGGGRYKDFSRNSNGHNAPVFGTYGQKAGKDFRAETFTVSGDIHKKIIRIDLTKAYPEEAGVLSCIRTITVTDDSVQVQDCCQCRNAVVPEVRLFHQKRPVIRTECPVEQKTLPLSDPWLKQKWGNSVEETVVYGNESCSSELNYTIFLEGDNKK